MWCFDVLKAGQLFQFLPVLLRLLLPVLCVDSTVSGHRWLGNSVSIHLCCEFTFYFFHNLNIILVSLLIVEALKIKVFDSIGD